VKNFFTVEYAAVKAKENIFNMLMGMKRRIVGSILCIFILMSFQTAICQVRLPHLISDGMVLQRDTRVKIWGWAAPGEKVTIRFNDSTYTTMAGTDSAWAIIIAAEKAGGPYTMDIQASNRITIKNILIGDVWVCSGQSNMVLPMERVKELYGDVIARSDNQEIRHFSVPMRYDFTAPGRDILPGRWEPANPDNVLHFTAAGYFFARALYEKYRVPIGLINASVGGTPIEAWMSEDALKQFPASLEVAEKFKDSLYLNEVRIKDSTKSAVWNDQLNLRDQGYNGGEKSWFDTSYDASAWSSMRIPSYWDVGGVGHVNGVVWFRKEIEVPVTMTGKPARLRLGRIVDSDSVYINGIFAGTVSYQYPPRNYDLSPNVLKPGKNIIVIRVVNTSGRGGFIKDKPYSLSAGGQIIDLKGEWKYRLGAVTEPLPDPTFIQYQPVGLFNGMIAPLMNYSMKGVIWYQGESNTIRAIEYQKMFPVLINDWRQKWNQGVFPFLFVQLANFMEAVGQPSESNWARLREAQRATLFVPNTGMAVTIDIGEWNDIHPLNKADVGTRLALAAQKIAYGDATVEDSGPVYQSMKIEGGKIVISFTHTSNGLWAKGGGELKHFAIAGTDKKFVWAHASIEGNTVSVWNNQIPKPVAVRYAWADNPEGANLYNKEGLPASPFRTDR
jgi:sialate O-acetylesterase